MIAVTIQVTDTPMKLRQIHFLGIRNVSTMDNELQEYEVTVDGKTLPGVINKTDDEDALTLIHRSLDFYLEWRSR